jgi:hypothetical protein
MSVYIVSENGRYKIGIEHNCTTANFIAYSVQDVRSFVHSVVTAYRSFVGRYQVMSNEEWASLSPQVRHELNVMQMELEEAQSDRDTLRKQIVSLGVKPEV